MPMLERTAATLEPCSLHKVLPSVSSSVRSRRQLHTAFWNHGAASVELFDACQALLGDAMQVHPAAPTPGPAVEKRADLMTASVFLLDFLYPRGALSLLRKLHCNPLGRYEKQLFRFNNSLSRFRIATTANAAYLGTSSPAKIESDLPVRDVETDMAEIGPDEGDYEASDTPLVPVADLAKHPGVSQFGQARLSTDPEKLKKALKMGFYDFPENIWDMYDNLRPDMKADYKLDVLKYVAAASRLVHPRRYCDYLFSLAADQWTDGLANAGIRAALSLDDFPAAMSIFKRTLEPSTLAYGFDLILAQGLKKGRWASILELWDSGREGLGAAGLPLVKFRATSKIDDLSRRLDTYWAYLRTKSSEMDWSAMKESYDSLLLRLVTNSLPLLQSSDAVFILRHLDQPVPYEEYIKLCISRGDHKLAADLYSLYRKLPGVRIRIPLLREMLGVFYPQNEHGMEMVLKDWYSRYEYLDYIGYRTFIRYYAGLGNVKSALRLWKEFKTVHGYKAVQDKRTVQELLHVFAVRGDVERTRQVFEEVTLERGKKPTTYQYNMLLNAHAHAWDLQGALRTFAELCENGKPDNYSFGFLMGITAARGNIQLTLGLYKLAREVGLSADVAMIDSLVEAYCQNDQISGAESLCSIATTRRMLPDSIVSNGKARSPYTILWNTVLRHYALRRDLSNVNRVLEDMSARGISYDGKTYEYLLLALICTRQADHALTLLKLSEKNGTFVPTEQHFLLLMSGFLVTRRPNVVMDISHMMTRRNLPDSAEKMTHLMRAFGVWARLPQGQRTGTSVHTLLVGALTMFRKSLGSQDPDDQNSIRLVTDQYSRMIDVLTNVRDFATIPEIVALFESQYPEYNTADRLPLKLLASLMRADFYEQEYGRVKSTWQIILNNAKALSGGRPPSSIPVKGAELLEIAPAHRHLLDDALEWVIKAYEAEGDTQDLSDLVKEVRAAGFRLGKKNWNYFIQALARSGRWAEAFTACEEILMPHWHGWIGVRNLEDGMGKRPPLDLRRMGRSDRQLRPTFPTLMVLIKHYLELEQLSYWSSEAAEFLDLVTNKCPRIVKAARTLKPTGSEFEKQVFSDSGIRDAGDDLMRYILKDRDFFRSSDDVEQADLNWDPGN